MNSSEFYKEVLQSDLCPPNFEEAYNRFRSYQKLLNRTLLAFHQVCEKAGIKYQLAFGSLLGCIRDNGQIPWDYDIDVLVSFTDRERLIRELKENLDQDYYYWTHEPQNTCRHVLLRLAPKGYDTDVLHVDVFFITGLPNKEEEALNHEKRIIDATLTLKARRYRLTRSNFRQRREHKRMLHYYLKGLFKRDKDIWKDYLTTVMQYPFEESEKCCLADRYASLYDLDTDLFEETVLRESQLGMLRIPVRYDEILTRMYGNYQELPDLETRIHEMMSKLTLLEKCAAVK